MRYKINRNSFCKDILEVIKKHSYIGKIRQNKKFLRIKTKNFDITLNIKHKVSKRRQCNNYYKSNLFTTRNESLTKEEIKQNYSSNESMEDKNKISKNEDTFDKKNVQSPLSEDYKNKRNDLSSNKSYKENNESFNSLIKEKEKENKEIINNNNPKGLLNLGLNCYMNALLQCLFYIKELREYFIQNKDKFTEEQVICKAFSDVMIGLLKNDKKDYFVPTEFKKLIGDKNKLFRGRKAGDIKDLFFNLFDTFLTELNKEYDNEDSDLNEPNCSDKVEMFLEAKKEIDRNNNIINELFIGYYIARYDCSITNKKIYTFQTESFILFDLEKCKNYFEQNDLSLEILFCYYCRRQNNSSFSCNHCNKLHTGYSYERIYRPPKILVIILDRGHGKKFKGKVEINKILDLKSFVVEEKYKKNCKYELICVSSHRGASSESGHYTACCKTDNNKYYYFSDSYVIEINEKNFIQEEPYLLFYKQTEINEQDMNNINEKNKDNQINNKLKSENYNITSMDNNANENINERENQSKNENQKIFKDNNNNQGYESNIKLNRNNNENNDDLKNNKTKFNYVSENHNNNKLTVSKHYSHKIKSEDIKYALNKFKYCFHNKYNVDYYDQKYYSPYVWKLKISGPKNTHYEGRTFNFKLDFNKDFNYITDIIIYEDKNYNLNFVEENGLLLFDYEYNEKISFYQNVCNLFESLYSLFINPTIK